VIPRVAPARTFEIAAGSTLHRSGTFRASGHTEDPSMPTSLRTTLVLLGALVFATACSSAAGGGGTGGTGGASQCEPLIADGTGTPVTVRLVNQTSADLFVQIGITGSCTRRHPFVVTDATNTPLATVTEDSCGSTCSHFACTCVTTYTCIAPEIVRIAPQGAYAVPWNGTVLEDRTVPTSCLGSGPCSGAATTQDCKAWVAPKSFPLAFTAQAYPECAGGTCTVDATGSCVVTPYGLTGPTGTAVNATATLARGATGLDLVFE
jgi:hypothetical protein